MDISIVLTIFALVVGVGASMLSTSPPEFLIARMCFIGGAVILAVGLFYFLCTEDRPLIWKIIIGLGAGLAILVVIPQLMILTNNKEIYESHTRKTS
jgi:hypothetical protein